MYKLLSGILMMAALMMAQTAGCSSGAAPGDDGGLPDGTADAGKDGGDGTSCIPAEEVCDGIDNDCDGKIDEGVCQACRCDYWGVAMAKGSIPMPNVFGISPARFRNFETAFDGDGVLAFLTGDDGARKTAPVWFALRRLDGSAAGTDRELAPAGSTMVDVEWSGSRWLAAWRQAEGDGMATFIAALSPEGATVAGPVKIAGAIAVAAAADNEIYVVYRGGAGGVFVQRLDGQLAQSGTPIALSSLKDAFDARAVGGAVAITGSGEPGTTKYLALIRGGALVREVELMKVASSYSGVTPGDSFVAADGDGIVACWKWSGGIWCRHVSPADGATLGPAFAVSLDETSSWDIARASCSMALLTGLQIDSGSQGKFVMNHFGTDQTVDTRTVDRQWIQPRQTLRLFAARDGRLVRVLDACQFAADEMTVAISTLRCREEPAPVTDCDALNTTACGFACGDLCSHPAVDCGILRGDGSGRGFPASQCHPIDCNVVDAPRCQERLAEPQECGSTEGTGYWLIPADCALPR